MSDPGPGRPGALIAGRYRLGAAIGRGGMASVYRGHDERLDRSVAIKLARVGRETIADAADGERRDVEAGLARLRREALAAAKLRHPNVVAVYDAGDEDGIPYIVMELVDGPDLRTVVARDGRPDVETSLTWIHDALGGLADAHHAGIVHRDVKPANLLLHPAGRVMVTDFGIARVLTDATLSAAAHHTLTLPGTVIGTIAYLAPEQARGQGATPRSDVYASCAVLYEWLAGVPPRPAGSLPELADSLARRAPVAPLIGRVPGVTTHVDATLRRGLALDPEDRLPDAAALSAALAGRASPAVRLSAPTAATGVVRPTGATGTGATAAGATTPVTAATRVAAPDHAPTAATTVRAAETDARGRPRLRGSRASRRLLAVLAALLVVAVIGAILVARSGDDATGNETTTSVGVTAPVADPAVPLTTATTYDEQVDALERALGGG